MSKDSLIYEEGESMRYLLHDVRKLCKTRIYKMVMIMLLIIAIIDPISSYEQFQVYNSQGNYFPYWLLMNSSGWGHAFYFNLLFILPILLTGFQYYYERSSSMIHTTITKVGRGKYFASKIISVFFVSFISICFFLLLNLIVTCGLYGVGNVAQNSYYAIPREGMFVRNIFERNPFGMVILYCFLVAFMQSVLALWTLGVHMILGFRKLYTAFLVPFLGLYIVEYLVGFAGEVFGLYAYNPLMILQPQAAAVLLNDITWKHVGITSFVMILVAVALLWGGVKRNEELL